MSQNSNRFKQIEIGELPEEWEVKKLNDLFIECRERLDPRRYPEEIFTLYSIPAYDENRQPEVLKGAQIGSQKTILNPPVLLISRLNPHIYRVWLVDHCSPYRAIASTEFIALQPKPILNKNFAYYLCISPLVREKVQTLVEGTTGSRQRVSGDDVLEILVPLPPLEEQKRIAGVLRLVDEIAEKTKRIISFYEKVKKYALNQLLTKGIGHSKFKQTEIGELPEEWEVKPLSQVLLDHQAGDWGKDMKEYNPQFHLPMKIIRSTEFTKDCRLLPETAVDRAIPKKKAQKIHLQEGDILVERSGGGPKQPVGRAVLVKHLPQGAWGFGNFIQRLRVKPEFSPEFVWAVLYWHWIKGSVLSMQEQTTGIRNLRWNDYLNLPIPLPPLEEQKKITELLSALDRAIDNERRYLQDLEKLKRWMLDNLLTGKVRLPQEIDELLKEVFYDVF
ncbi:MAG: restriction endonuclease subunit S [Caldisericum sp.]